MNIQQLAPELWVIKNFLSSSECKDVINQVESAPEQWSGRDDAVFYKVVKKENRKDSLNEKTYNAKRQILKSKLKGLDYFIDETFVKFTQGGFMGIHYDNFQNEQAIEYTNSHADLPRTKRVTNQKYSSVLYLNDHEGGELYYPKWDVIYKPVEGDLIIHSASTIESMHGSMPLKSSERYIFISSVYESVMVNEDIKVVEDFFQYYSTKYPEDFKTINWAYKGLTD